MPPLPPELAQAVGLAPPGAGKRERTRAQLVVAAIDVFCARGVAQATVQEIAARAGMTTGTVYNHFKTKEDIVRELGSVLALTLCDRIAASQKGVPEGARRMAIGNRRYLWLAKESPAWALLLLQVAELAPETMVRIGEYALADLRLGVRQKSFKPASEAAGMDLIQGTISRGMVSIARGAAPAGHDIAITASVLRGLGMAADEAATVARMPLPPFPPAA